MMMFIASPSLQKAPTLLLVMLMEGHTDNVFSLSFSPDCKLLCSGSDDKSIKFWNPADGSLVKSIDEAHTSGVTITADSNFIVSANTDKTVIITPCREYHLTGLTPILNLILHIVYKW